MVSQTIREVLNRDQKLLNNEAGYLETQLLLSKTLQKPRTWLIAHDEELVRPDELERYMVDLNKRDDGYPIAYLLGSQEFWDLNLIVTEDTLIPRPETECLVEEVIQRHPNKNCTVVDLGTGTGAIALALASEFGEDQVVAMDKSQAAIEITRMNQQRHNLSNVQLFVGSWGDGLAENSVDILVSNPPYISEQDQHLTDLRYEPMSALVSGQKGLDDIQSICKDARRYLRPGAQVFIEHGFNQQHEVIDILTSQGFNSVEGKRDLANQPRFVVAVAP